MMKKLKPEINNKLESVISENIRHLIAGSIMLRIYSSMSQPFRQVILDGIEDTHGMT